MTENHASNPRKNTQKIAQFFLRLSIGVAYFIFGTDRLGLWGKYGEKNVSWGDWQHFMIRAEEIMNFLPHSLVEPFAVIATAAEISFGVLLIIGFKTRLSALGSGILALLFAISMTISGGFLSPLGYGVFAISAASFLLYTIESYDFSIDKLLRK